MVVSHSVCVSLNPVVHSLFLSGSYAPALSLQFPRLMIIMSLVFFVVVFFLRNEWHHKDHVDFVPQRTLSSPSEIVALEGPHLATRITPQHSVKPAFCLQSLDSHLLACSRWTP